MKKIEPSLIQKLLDEIKSFERAIKTAGDEKRDKLATINIDESKKGIPLKNGEELDTGAWSALEMDEQHKLYNKLSSIKKAMESAAGLDGTKDPKHIMSASYASTFSILFLAVLSFIFTIALFYIIILNWDKATGTDLTSKIEKSVEMLNELDTLKQKQLKISAINENFRIMIDKSENDSIKLATYQDSLKMSVVDGIRYTKEQEEMEKELDKTAREIVSALREGGATEAYVVTMVILLGMLGGMLHLIRSLVMFVGNRQFKRSWILYYLSMPLTGAGLALIIYMLLRVGLLNPSDNIGSSISNLNLVAIYAFAGLTGLFARTALDKLSEVFSTIFQTETQTKDTLGTEKPSERKTE